ncbi:cyanophycinase [Arcticibacter tournemirensis]
MKRIHDFMLASLLFVFSSAGYAQQKAQNKTVGPENGSLIIVGGGKVGPQIWSRFIELAGGESANIVVIPTAGEDSSISKGGLREKQILESLGVSSVTIVHTRDPKVADTEKFVAPLKKATGIWFVGGRQWRIADAFLNTRAHREFNNLLKRGGVIAGTSAGATIQGSFLLRGDTKGNSVLVGDHVQGLNFIHNVAIDQHILKRNRQFDLIDVVKARPELLGIGIDESTAILVQKDIFEVLGDSYVAVYDAAQINSKIPFTFFGRGQRYDLRLRKEINDVARHANLSNDNR